jgi:Xaa-Pro aminopeptidase
MIRNTETATMKEKYFESIIFPENEYRERYKKIQSLMKREGFQLLILTDDRYTWYYTGFGGAAPMGARCRPRILFIPATGDPVFLVHQSTMFCVNEMICFGKVAGYANLESMPVEQIKKCIAEFALGRGDVIGMEFGREMRININFQDVNNLIASCADYVFKDAADILIEQRTIKTELEIERIKKACSITSEAYKYGFPQIKSNMTELQIGGILENTMLELGAQGTWSWVIGSDYIRIDGLTRSKKVEEAR